MNKQTRRKFSADFKAKVALEAVRSHKTLAQLGQQYEINPITIAKWKSELLERVSIVFEHGRPAEASDSSAQVDHLFAQIGMLKVENDFLKKSARRLGLTDKEQK